MWPRCIWPMVICCWAHGIVPTLSDSVPMEPERITPGSATEPCSTRPTRLNCCCRMVDLRNENNTQRWRDTERGVKLHETHFMPYSIRTYSTLVDMEPLGVVRFSKNIHLRHFINDTAIKRKEFLCVSFSENSENRLHNCVGLWRQNKEEQRCTVLPLHAFARQSSLFLWQHSSLQPLGSNSTKRRCEKCIFQVESRATHESNTDLKKINPPLVTVRRESIVDKRCNPHLIGKCSRRAFARVAQQNLLT